MAKNKRAALSVEIIAPRPEEIFKLKAAFPIETDPIILQVKVSRDGRDISSNVKIVWQLRLSYQATHKTYQTRLEIYGNPVKIKFETGGILRIRAAVVIDGREYSNRIKTKIIGANPGKTEIMKILDSDLLKALAWQESTWQQFDSNGKPLPPVVPKGHRVPSMRGLFQISEWWWAEERTPLALKDFNRMAWQWNYNLQVAKLILEHYRNRILKNFPDESLQKQQDWVLKAYKAGPAVFGHKEDPGNFWYVIKIRGFMKNKPWLKQ